MPIAVYSRPRYCSRCQRWLGGNKKSGHLNIRRPSYKENNAALWQGKTIGELFDAAPAECVSEPACQFNFWGSGLSWRWKTALRRSG